MNTFKVQFFSPDNQVSFDKVVSLLMNVLDGELMILAHHSPYLIYLLPGVVTVRISKQKEEKIVIDNGVLEVVNNDCSIITNQVQFFNCVVHNEELFRSRRINMQLNYFDQ
ncbi:F0F1 ATP synthase subunit epsilon [Wolbachia endosymbiont of Dirofilaria (Dirofilaria) immitis]|uniref:F0F1 ATP synthase subunit epsilon n=1 Tax=Wolbachia endosymbiont of Dirofilaria (Dirofilaria) immitis TaxID=1812115 RepID=UPI00158A6901|nr:F0F1 ATP synthase subunit epsilon [Wolbachia endosymbiont of Dirofilaria (Dirofilaria) immitis]QKX02098.1 F0F1 ATP synthase subunit epsilon [Wolbachia endosymbiont of Dirofilaria (Dirofilaria) immitis]